MIYFDMSFYYLNQMFIFNIPLIALIPLSFLISYYD